LAEFEFFGGADGEGELDIKGLTGAVVSVFLGDTESL